MNITLAISQDAVLAEVEQKTNYVGSKMVDDESAYERIITVDENEPELLMFWDECRAELIETLSGKLVSEGLQPDNDTYELVLSVPDNFDTSRHPAMKSNLFFYFVYALMARWFMFTNKGEADVYAGMSNNFISNLKGGTLKRAFMRKGFL